MPKSTKSLHRTVPIAETITKVGHGLPDKLVIFKLPASKYWWVRYYVQGKVIKKSTKTTVQRDAVKFAKKFYEDILLRERNLLPLSYHPSFEKVAYALLDEQEQLIERGERNPKLNKNDRQKLEKDVLPFFKGFNVKDVTYKHLNEYLAKLNERDLKPATLKVHLNLIHKILVLAHREGLIDKMPLMPKVALKDSPRGWFSNNEYELLKKTTIKAVKDKVVVRGKTITDEMRFLVTLMVNTFLRPSDIKNLRHRNVEVVRGEHTYLRIQTDDSKTVNHPIVSMPAAVGIYEDLLAFQKKTKKPYKKDDFLFFPDLQNRSYALQTMRRQFDELLARSDLKKSSTGEPRTLYSLRHTAIMFRLTMGESVDLLTLARNARTSVEMIERFYAKPLQAEMNVGKIQSMRRR